MNIAIVSEKLTESMMVPRKLLSSANAIVAIISARAYPNEMIKLAKAQQNYYSTNGNKVKS